MHALALRYDNFWASAGVHPDNEDVQRADASTTWSSWPRGRRWWRSARPASTTTASNGRSVADMEWQRERFRVHIRAARATGLPLVDPHPQRLATTRWRVLREEGGGAGRRRVPLLHRDRWTVARAALDLGFHISFSGILTFRNAAGPARGGALRAAGPLPDRDRQPLPGAGAVPRQGQQPGLRAVRGAPAGRAQGAAASSRWRRRRARTSNACSSMLRKPRSYRETTLTRSVISLSRLDFRFSFSSVTVDFMLV